ncbi:hypothetical protein ABPG74_001461 [Tetrahymena malaccensis]
MKGALKIQLFTLILIIQKCQSQLQQIPQYSESQILVARSFAEKGTFETCSDFILTLGNQRYVDTYYQLKKIRNQTYIYEVQHLNEQFADDFKQITREGPTEFDIRSLFKMRINNEQFDLAKTNSTSSNKKNIFIQFLKFGVSFQFMKQTTFQTFKVMNNALLKKGAQQFIVIGGRQMMKVGKEIAMKQGGKFIGKAVVKQVTHEGGKRAALTVAQTAINWGTLGLSFVGQAAFSYGKAVFNSGWMTGKKKVQQVENEFNFTQIYEDEQQYLNDQIMMASFNQSLIFLEGAIQEIEYIKQNCTNFTEQIGKQNITSLFQFFSRLTPVVQNFKKMKFEEILGQKVQINRLIRINMKQLKQFNQLSYTKFITQTSYYLLNTQITDFLTNSLQFLDILTFFSNKNTELI